jgi:hypothetical protein
MEKSETPTDELTVPTHMTPAPSKRRPSKGSKNVDFAKIKVCNFPTFASVDDVTVSQTA